MISRGTMVWIALSIVAGIALFWLSGAVINALLQDRSLGIIGNAAVLIMGASMGFWMKILIFGPVVNK